MLRNIADFDDLNWCDSFGRSERWAIGPEDSHWFCKDCGYECDPDDGCEVCGTGIYMELDRDWEEAAADY